MIKNIILDVGGILFDDSLENTNRIFNKNSGVIYRKAYSGNFKKCLLGEMNVEEHLNELRNDKDYNDIQYLFDNLNISLPLIKDNFEYIKTLYEDGYNLYLLTNMDKNTYSYISNVINLEKYFAGGIYSFKERCKKPDLQIYELIFKRYNLNKSETLFFDDKEKNVLVAKEFGIKAFVFKDLNDIKKQLEVKNEG